MQERLLTATVCLAFTLALAGWSPPEALGDSTEWARRKELDK